MLSSQLPRSHLFVMDLCIPEECSFRIMSPSVYSVRYILLILFYLAINFVLIIIVKSGSMNLATKRIFVPERTNRTTRNQELRNERWKNSQFSDICKKYNLSTPLKRRNFLYSSKYKSLYCWIRKVASTSFTKLFSDMKRRKVTQKFYREVDILAPKSRSALKSVLKDGKVHKFLVVRHPFERLVSSYRDRLQDNSKYTAQAWIFAREIFLLTRPYLFRSNSTSGGALDIIFDGRKRLKIIPSFSEFVEWLLSGNPLNDDPHWNQYFRHCSLCEVHYNSILHLENDKISETNFLFSKIGLNQKNIGLQILEASIGGSTDFPRACRYFTELSRDKINRLHERYKVDFEMFGYKVDDYIKCAADF